MKAPRIIGLLFSSFFLFAFANCGCKPGVVKPVIAAVIDCLAQDRAQLDSLGAELLPLIATGDWSTFEAKASAAGVSIGGCIAAELIQKYLAPPPGNAAPSPESGQAARATMERLRAGWKGATFKTSQGTL